MDRKHIIKTGLILACVTCFLVACQHKEKQTQGYTMLTVSEKSITNILYYEGHMTPMTVMPVIAPIDGVIDKMFFNYGGFIENGQLLYSIKSTDQKSDFGAALTDYLKAKQDYDTNNDKLQSSKMLHDRGLISNDDYEQTQNTFYISRLAFMQAQDTFNKILTLYDIQLPNLGSLQLKDIDAIRAAIDKQKKSAGIKVVAPEAGIALFPKEGGTDADKVQVGAQVKQGQILVNLGDMSGIAIKIQINQIDIDSVHENQKATISSDVIQNFHVDGYVKTVDAQATNTGNVPMFSAVVVGVNLSPEQQKLVKVGMGAKVAIMLQGEPQISIPIRAVFRRDGRYFVKMVNKATGKFTEVPITTGSTTQNSVVVVTGLKSGDQIVVPD